NPLSPREENGRLYGRGALDIKSGVSAICEAATAGGKEGKPLLRNCILGFVGEEESNNNGPQTACKQNFGRTTVLIETTNLKLCVAHKGYAWFEVITRGLAAHGSLPNVGRDAIRYMGRVLNGLESLDRRLSAAPAHRLLGRGSLHASIISGGHEVSSYPVE